MTTLDIELFDEYPYLANCAYAEYRKAREPVPARGRRVLNDILRKIKRNAADGQMTLDMRKYRVDSISYYAEPVTLREKWEAWKNDSEYAPSGIHIEMNIEDLSFVIDTLRKCGYNVSDRRDVGYSIYLTISWNDI